MNIIDKIILNKAKKVLSKHGNHYKFNNVHMVMMSEDFYEYTYHENYNRYIYILLCIIGEKNFQ